MKLSILQQALLMLSKKKRLLVLGDSHTALFNTPEFQKYLGKKYRLYVETVGGATISGLDNPNSKTNAKAIFDYTYKQIKPHILIVQLGEVDTGFVIWYRAQKYNASVSRMLETCIQNYQTFLRQYQGTEKTIIISAPLPTIKDNQEWGEIANLRKEITATQIDRTNLTIEFNTRVELMGKELGVNYINLDNESAGEDGLIANFLLNENPNDHHYSKAAYLPIVTKHLQDIL